MIMIKNKFAILTTLGLSALLGLTAVSLTGSKDPVTAKAEENDKYIFVQVTEYSDIRLGDTVIFASSNIAINRIGGNPVFTGGYRLSNGTGYYSKFNFESTDASMFTVENGYTGFGYYSFKCTRTADQETDYWLKTAGRYLSYGQGYHEDDHDLDTRGDVIYKKAKDEYSSFNVDFDSNGLVYLSRANEPNQYGKVDNPICIKWSSGYVENGTFGYHFGGSNLRMYRKVNVKKSNLDITISKYPYKTAYNAGEYSDLRGLELEIETNDTHMKFKSVYDLDEALFDALPVVYSETDNSYAPFKWLGITSFFLADVYPDRSEENNYFYVNGSKYTDLRGTYVLAAPGNGYTSILDTTRLAGENVDHFNSGYVVQLNGENINPICDSIYDEHGDRIIVSDVANNVVTIVKESDGYFIKIGSDYLAFEERPTSYYYVYRGSKAHSKPVTVDSNNDLVINFNGNKTLVYDDADGIKKVYLQEVSYSSSHEYQIKLFRYTMKGEQYSEMNTFKGTFLAKTASCDSTGEVNNLNLSDWQELASAFNALTVDSQSYLASLVYTHNQEEANSLKDMVDRYDHIVSKYSGDGFIDFMSRGDAGTLQQNSAYTFALINNIDNNTLIVVVVSIISVVSLTALLIFKKKRK